MSEDFKKKQKSIEQNGVRSSVWRQIDIGDGDGLFPIKVGL